MDSKADANKANAAATLVETCHYLSELAQIMVTYLSTFEEDVRWHFGKIDRPGFISYEYRPLILGESLSEGSWLSILDRFEKSRPSYGSVALHSSLALQNMWLGWGSPTCYRAEYQHLEYGVKLHAVFGTEHGIQFWCPFKPRLFNLYHQFNNRLEMLIGDLSPDPSRLLRQALYFIRHTATADPTELCIRALEWTTKNPKLFSKINARDKSVIHELLTLIPPIPSIHSILGADRTEDGVFDALEDLSDILFEVRQARFEVD